LTQHLVTAQKISHREPAPQMRVPARSQYLRLQQTTEAAVRDPTATHQQPTLGSRPTGWEPLV